MYVRTYDMYVCSKNIFRGFSIVVCINQTFFKLLARLLLISNIKQFQFFGSYIEGSAMRITLLRRIRE